MKDKSATSIIVTTYNWPEALRLTLGSVLSQSVCPVEVIIADDGSGPETACVINEVLNVAGPRWCHVWHEDKGVRQSRIKNLAVRYSNQPYLIFIDQDVVIHPDFIADHVSEAQEGCFLQGKRALLPKYYTDKIISEGLFRTPGFFQKGLGNRKNILRMPLIGKLFSGPRRFHTSLRGCNLSMFKSDFYAVDGFDEIFDNSWGREDSDICYRLFHSGLSIKTLWFSALQYHLKHSAITKWDKERLDNELSRTLEEKRVKAKKGFSKLSPEGKVMAASNDFFL